MGIKRIKRTLRESLHREPTDKEIAQEKKRLKKEKELTLQQAQEPNLGHEVENPARDAMQQVVTASAKDQESTLGGSVGSNAHTEPEPKSRAHKEVNREHEGSNANSRAENKNIAGAAQTSNRSPATPEEFVSHLRASTSAPFAQANVLQNTSLAALITPGQPLTIEVMCILVARATNMMLEPLAEFARILSTSL